MNSDIEIECGEGDISNVVREVASRIGDISWIGLVGELGAGKTTLTQLLLKEMGIVDQVTSPSYNLVNEYKIGEKVIEHWDLYRLKSEPEELIYSDADLKIIEWADKFPTIYDRCEMLIRISKDSNLRKYLISF